MKDKIVIGIDFGGTKIKTAAVSESGELLSEPVIASTEAERPADEIIVSMYKTVNETLEKAELRIEDVIGIGIGSPGPLDLERGIILNTPNLPTLRNFHLKEKIEQQFNVPVAVNNDANCFVLGEAFWGAGKDLNIVCGVTLGTGFGCGIVLNKTIYSGATGTAAEVWNSSYLDLNFEEYGAARGVVMAYRKITGQKSTALDIHNKAKSGEDTALHAWNEYGVHLGKIIAIMVNYMDPDVFVIGGSVGNAFPFFEKSMIENIHKHINPIPQEHLKILHAKLGNDAGVLGAAAQLFD
ncbi:ROK family protein [candidate division KSB1 bacterium]|nr:ROK family protein [candidate division KSB1 bacterium]